ncbi:MAG: polyribonucleotide nucleotidyltransferase [Candidatus Sungbacteria bacterium]|nr:polyribonucleotide nucleotidyltransferase [Candidatus Sungbacteria bacterium]
MTSERYTHTLNGKTFIIELTDWAEQAHGSVVVRLGDTVVLACAVMSPSGREGIDFFPLTVEYEEKYYATGKILGSRFIKRETRPSEEAVLAGRMIDRTIRPRFDQRMRNEVQIVITVLSVDNENDPDIPAMLGVSLALSLSDIPWNGPIAGVRVARKNAEFIANPLYAEREASDMDFLIAGTAERINMIEAGAREVSEEDCAKASEWGFGCIQELIAFEQEIIRKHAKEKRAPLLLTWPHDMEQLIRDEFSKRIESAAYATPKQVMAASLDQVKQDWFDRAASEYPKEFSKSSAGYLFEEEINRIVHRRILEKGERPDGRKPKEIRKISAAVGVLPRVHGSGLFMRGETHVLSTLTLGAPGDQQIIEGMEIRAKKHFLHHYNFPPFSTGEVKPMRGPGRREIGHGALAGKALSPLLPARDDFPYTIRVVSEVLSSNGSSSMASVCGSSLALMDAGVPIKKLAAGAAMGLMVNEKGDSVVLADIQGPEDRHGDMDFKVAGTRDGITAVQMDVKIDGLTPAMLAGALASARESRMQILDLMESVISQPRSELSPWAPRIITLKINPEKIGAVIGPGGKVINDIIAQTGVQIDIEDDGTVFITSEKKEGMDRALALVKQITREFKPGELVEGKVTRMFEFGAMVEIGPKQEGLIHISELAPWRVDRVEDIVRPGDTVPAVIKNIDDQGRVNLSLKDVPGRYASDEIARGRENQSSGYPKDDRRPSGRGRGRSGPPRGR